ncbi:MAG: peptide ABC transporter ATP-binding protein, partial [Planctomycetota bacterium]|nr:peptide ABC transporter ATP-binding protein [Planctomycetota bacterium]
ALFWNPQHPYTRGLLSSIPRLDRGSQKLRQIVGAPPDLSALPQGCPFAPRCDFVEDRCREQEPLLAPRGDGHTAACVVTLPKWEGAV